jgi:hypothetical protein
MLLKAYLRGLRESCSRQIPRHRAVHSHTRNGVEPLAAWLVDVGAQMWDNVEASRLGETVYPAQMSYSFTVQFTTGIDGRYSLINPVWNPLSPAATASTQQTSKLQITLNGPDASLVNGATIGVAVIGGIGGNPTYETIPGTAPPGPVKSLGLAPHAVRLVTPSTPTPRAGAQARAKRGLPQGYLLYPIPLPLR